MSDSLQTHAMDRALTAAADNLDRDLLGAWMAGYDYLHVYRPVITERRDDDLGQALRIGHCSIPSNEAKASRSVDYSYSCTYDLTTLDAETVDEYR